MYKKIKNKVGRPCSIQKIPPQTKYGVVNTSEVNDNNIEFSFDNVNIFKKIFNLFKTMIMQEINICFDKNFIKISGIDHLEKNIVNIKIDCTKVNKYFNRYKDPFNITLDSMKLNNITKKIDRNYNLFSIVIKKASNVNIILHNKLLNINEYHILNFIKSEIVIPCKNHIDYNLYPLNFTLPFRIFRKIINDIYTFSRHFNIEKVNGSPLKISYNTLTDNTKGFIIFSDDELIKLNTSLVDSAVFYVSVVIDYIKPLGNCLLADFVNIYADNEFDLVFNIIIDNGVMDIIMFSSISD